MTESEFFQKEMPMFDSIPFYFMVGSAFKGIKKIVYRKKDSVPLYADAVSTFLLNTIYLAYFLRRSGQSQIDWKQEWENFKSDPDRWSRIKEAWKISLAGNGSAMVLTFIGKRVLPSKEKHKWLHRHSWTRESMNFEQYPIKSKKDLWSMALAAVTTGPATEELLFRGSLMNGLREYFSDKTSVALSSLIFGLLHGGMVWASVGKGALLSATLDIEHQNIFYSVGEHYLNNLIAMAANIYNYYTQENSKEDESWKKLGKLGQKLHDISTNPNDHDYFYLVVGLIQVAVGWSKLAPWLEEHWKNIEGDESSTEA